MPGCVICIYFFLIIHFVSDYTFCFAFLQVRTIEDGIHTADIFKKDTSKKLVGTREFTREVIARLGSAPQKLPALKLDALPTQRASDLGGRTAWKAPPQEKILHGADIFLEWNGGSPDELAARIQAATAAARIQGLKLTLITNRGVKVLFDVLFDVFSVFNVFNVFLMCLMFF